MCACSVNRIENILKGHGNLYVYHIIHICCLEIGKKSSIGCVRVQKRQILLYSPMMQQLEHGVRDDMSDPIIVFTAWPYANGDLHLGHIAGCYLPADIFTRYHRLRGNDVVMVSGSDSHGTPIMLKAQELGRSPREVFEFYHERFLEDFVQLGITYDLFTHTDTANHARIAQDIFKRLYERGYIVKDVMVQLYCDTDAMPLPDRFVEGTCPHCGFENARGDQCDQCGHTLDATELIDPRCKLCGNTPRPVESEHFFLDLPAFEDKLKAYVEAQTHWRPNVRNFALNFLREGLQRRPVSRDIAWGIPLPIEGYEDKVMYVWFEAVIGYLSGAVQLAHLQGEPDAWKRYWYTPEARSYYFIGKDNIPFHAIIWPAELMGYDEQLRLPYDIPANEFLNLEGRQFSTSRNWAIWLRDMLSRYDPDPIRYYLTAIAPETRDSDFRWEGFVERNNNELVAAWGNLVNRVVSFASKRWKGVIPTPGDLDARDTALLETIRAGFDEVGEAYERVQLRDALRLTMALAREVNKYLDDKAPWFQIKEDKQAAATTIYVALQAIDWLKVLFAPVLPFSSEKVHAALGYAEPLFGEPVIETVQEGERAYKVLRYRSASGGVHWQPTELEAGRPLQRLDVLFKKLDESIVQEELSRLG